MTYCKTKCDKSSQPRRENCENSRFSVIRDVTTPLKLLNCTLWNITGSDPSTARWVFPQLFKPPKCHESGDLHRDIQPGSDNSHEFRHELLGMSSSTLTSKFDETLRK
jgi:hypothetical protein